MIDPLPADAKSKFIEEHHIGDTTPLLYPIYPTADSITERNEFVYAFPEYGFKLVIGPVERDDGLLVWRVERHPESTNGDMPDIFPTFSAAFDRAVEYADERFQN